MNRTARLGLLLGLLVAGGASAALVSTSGIYLSGGVSYVCSPVKGTRMFKCTSESGRTVYVAGDTQDGARIKPLPPIDRDEDRVCYEDVGVSSDQALDARWTGGLDDLLRRITDERGTEEDLAAATELWAAVDAQAEDERWSEVELELARAAAFSAWMSEPAAPVSLRRTACDDGRSDDGQEWADELLRAW